MRQLVREEIAAGSHRRPSARIWCAATATSSVQAAGEGRDMAAVVRTVGALMLLVGGLLFIGLSFRRENRP
jgi:hypothetical protein